jgi:urease accessory protein
MRARSGFLAIVIMLCLAADPALAHHLMGGRMPATLAQGLLSGLGHPVIGLDHLATIVAVGCLAAGQRLGAGLVIGFVVAMAAGVAAHVQGVTLAGADMMTALGVIVLGAVLLRGGGFAFGPAAAIFAVAGLLNGYAFGESIFGAERAPLYAYLAGLAAIQAAVGIAAMMAARTLRDAGSDPAPLRLVGGGIAGIGIALAAAQILPAT